MSVYEAREIPKWGRKPPFESIGGFKQTLCVLSQDVQGALGDVEVVEKIPYGAAVVRDTLFARAALGDKCQENGIAG